MEDRPADVHADFWVGNQVAEPAWPPIAESHHVLALALLAPVGEWTRRGKPLRLPRVVINSSRRASRQPPKRRYVAITNRSMTLTVDHAA